MGRELQKKKNRSSLHKVRRKPKSKKKVLSNPIIAANWNQKETLSQNYRRLGLTAKLNQISGGVEKKTGTETQPTGLIVSSSIAPKNFKPGETRVERDPETGAILRIIDDGSDAPKANPLADPLNELEDSDPEEWNGFSSIPTSRETVKTSVIEQLEAQAASGARKAPRKQSTREEEWIERLVQKHGDNYAAMFRDAKLNPMQQSEGDIKRRIKKWEANRTGSA